MFNKKNEGEKMNYKIGMILNGMITGVQPYGAFVSLDSKTQGLIHVSEIQTGYTQNIDSLLGIGQKVIVQIIDIDEYSKKISLSLRTLEEQIKIVNYHHKKYYTDKNKKIGFSSLEKQLPFWIDEMIDRLIRK
ncbi:general stress protein [Melissococcus plutonius ATCC 35311]|uniref:General stress protein n=3 Tax=Melissococcus plutonius TaxID=33970 RepID=F3Y951_MELPT|nr:general stress protein [Melissococcus plutonius ATCC 35311]BAL62569.1 general stress protein [Melissococcus plutonius DAT561]BBC61455.1 general stress protein 13 [Melissococcus plutonius]BBD14866.1 general stress protein 13 [Melissococcus plutonius]BBD17361.1 general stress protein 13 [Melissococcus plutonius]